MMAPPRRRELVKSRRRVADDEEEEAGSETAPLDDDSLSEATLSDLDDEDADADGSEISEQDEAEARHDPPKQEAPAVAAHAHTANGTTTKRPAVVSSQPSFAPASARGDTHAMMNGLDMPARSDDADEIEFDDLNGNGVVPKAPPAKANAGKPSGPHRPEPQPDRKRQTQDEYRQKRDADPTFVPNRGGFFMHDHRHPGRGANGFRPSGKGRGRGRGRGAGDRQTPMSNLNGHAPEPMSGPWSHDLHETVAQDRELVPHQNPPRTNGASLGNGPRLHPPSNKTAAPIRSFSKSTHIGNTQIRVFLPNMKEPITFPAVPVKRHTRLPQHRPPLRRDKPVRISLSGSPPRYIFPTVERSFIFIPRALRPNHQGHHGRPGGPGARGGFGPSRGTSSGRPSSVYAWSAYSPSAPISRRSSLAQEMNMGRDYAISRATSTASRPPGGPADLSRPIVRLPPATDPSRHMAQLPDRFKSSVASQPTLPEAASLAVQQEQQQQQQQHHQHQHQHQPQQYQQHQHQQYQHPPPPLPPPPPLDAQPLTYHENRQASLPMHQPRPQKAVSVAGIDSPEKVSFPRPPQQLQLPFHQQMPHDLNGNNAYGANPSQSHPHSRDPSFPSQPSTGTPLSHIPERAIHAQPFQPQSMPMIPPAPYAPGYPGPASQPVIYYPSSDPRAATFGAPPTSSAPSGPMYVPGQAPPGPPSGTVAQESNGMVYYYDAAQVFGATAGAYLPGTFAVAPTGGVIGMGGMMTPTPDGYYYPHSGPGTVFYGP